MYPKWWLMKSFNEIHDMEYIVYCTGIFLSKWMMLWNFWMIHEGWCPSLLHHMWISLQNRAHAWECVCHVQNIIRFTGISNSLLPLLTHETLHIFLVHPHTVRIRVHTRYMYLIMLCHEHNHSTSLYKTRHPILSSYRVSVVLTLFSSSFK